VGDVIGGRKTIIQEYPALPSSLPNRIVVEGARYDKLPTQLQQRVTYSLGKDALGQPVNPTTFAYSTLNNEKVTLSFRPATVDDEAALQALLPEGEITDVSQLPSSIPSYLIEVIPEFKVNGELKISGESMALGQELTFNTTIDFPGRSKQEDYDYNVIAGSYLSVNVVAGDVSSSKFDVLSSRMGIVSSNLSDGDDANNSMIDREKTLGDMYYAGTLIYFAKLLTMTRAISARTATNYSVMAGYGTFGYIPRVDYLFGFPVNVKPGVVSLDIPINIVSGSVAGDLDERKTFVHTYGVLSSILEHAIPEEIYYDNESVPLDFMSAIKGLQVAIVEGQNVYTITKNNVNDIVPLLIISRETENEILESTNTGLSVIIHESPIDVPGFSGVGYVILDPDTGSGAYKISGGSNGGEGEVELVDTSAGVATGTTGLLFASLDSVVGSFSSYAGDIKEVQKVMGKVATFVSGLKLMFDLFHDDCVSAAGKFIIFAVFAALTAMVIALVPTVGGILAAGAQLASAALPSLMLSLAGSFAVDKLINRIRDGLSSC